MTRRVFGNALKLEVITSCMVGMILKGSAIITTAWDSFCLAQPYGKKEKRKRKNYDLIFFINKKLKINN